jgi:hypothetical protein
MRAYIINFLAAIALLAHIIGLLMLVPSAFADDASSCYAISDRDQRAFCLAKSHGQASMCYAVQDQALRARCLAEVRN